MNIYRLDTTLTKLNPFWQSKVIFKNKIVANDMKIQAINNTSYFTEFNLSLLDMKKSLNLAIKYTKMRKQFKTIPDTKE